MFCFIFTFFKGLTTATKNIQGVESLYQNNIMLILVTVVFHLFEGIAFGIIVNYR